MRASVLPAALLFVTGSASAQTAPVSVWYRNSEGCPDGASFVARLNDLGKSARLAGVGDRVDFVVTLGHEQGSSSGRLERQTRNGVVAMQEFRDEDCARVAEALALTLDLALDPSAAPPAADEPMPAATPLASAQPSDSPSTAHAMSADRPGASDEGPQLPPGGHGTPSRTSVAFGAQLTLATGVAPEVLPGGALFVALATSGRWAMSARLTLLGGHTEGSAQPRGLEVTLLGARADYCPLRSSPSLELMLEPCLGVETGVIRGAGTDAAGITDTGFWGSALAQARGAFRIGGAVWLEAQAGARVPWVRYEMGTRDGSAEWFRTRAVGLDVALGASWQFQ